MCGYDKKGMMILRSRARNVGKEENWNDGESRVNCVKL